MMSPTDLQVVDVDFLNEKNCKTHHTLDYRIMRVSKDVNEASLVVRRGETLTMHFTFNRNVVQNEDKIFLNFEEQRFGKNHGLTKWRTKIRYHTTNRKLVLMEAIIPVDAPIGEYYPVVTVMKKEQSLDKSKHYTIFNIIYVLFNPWCESDPVYIPDEKDRQDYVLGDSGYYYHRLKDEPEEREFTYDQFHPLVIRVVFHLIGGAQNFDLEDCKNPVKVLRALGLRTNYFDDGETGLLRGNWDVIKDYTNPWEWSSVSQIVAQYAQNGYREAKYGQCFTFSCVFTALCRCLGIGARVVMVARSCSDWDDKGYMKIKYSNTYAKLPQSEQEHIPNTSNSRDSEWNFHEINEVWLRRDDLKEKFPRYAGADWQAMDITPQQMYDTFVHKTPPTKPDFIAGPTPRLAIKERFDAAPYDVSIFRRYVMCGLKHFQGDRCFQSEHDVAADYIGTWNPRTGGYINLKEFYKIPKWYEKLAKGRAIPKDDQNVANLHFESLKSAIMYKAGEDWKGNIGIRNSANEKANIEVVINATINDYTGKVLKTIPPVKRGATLMPNAAETFEWDYKPPAYDLPVLGSGNTLCIIVVAIKGGAVVVDKKTFPIVCPAPTLNILSKPPYMASGKIEVEICFTNPLDKKLNQVEFVVGGSEILRVVKEADGTVNPKAKCTEKVILEIPNHSKMNISANLRSKEYQTDKCTKEIMDIQNFTKEHIKVKLDKIVETKLVPAGIDDQEVELIEDNSI